VAQVERLVVDHSLISVCKSGRAVEYVRPDPTGLSRCIDITKRAGGGQAGWQTRLPRCVCWLANDVGRRENGGEEKQERLACCCVTPHLVKPLPRTVPQSRSRSRRRQPMLLTFALANVAILSNNTRAHHVSTKTFALAPFDIPLDE
jgi:hypothetical protein